MSQSIPSELTQPHRTKRIQLSGWVWLLAILCLLPVAAIATLTGVFFVTRANYQDAARARAAADQAYAEQQQLQFADSSPRPPRPKAELQAELDELSVEVERITESLKAMPSSPTDKP